MFNFVNMKRIINLIIFTFLLALVVSITSCNKPKKTRSSGYTCSSWKAVGSGDSVLLEQEYFDYPMMSADSMEVYLWNCAPIPGTWYICN